MNAAELSTQRPVGTVKPQFLRLASALQLASISASNPGRVPVIALVVYVASALGMAAVALAGADYLAAGAWWSVILTLIFALVALGAIFVMFVHVQNTTFDTFKASTQMLCYLTTIK